MRPVPAQVAAKLYAAADLMADQGLDNTKIDEIAAATGVPKATLYYYFAGKEDILVFLFNDFLAVMAGDVLLAVDADKPASERLADVVEAQLRRMFEQPAVCRALIGDLGRAGRLPEIAEAINGAFYSPLERLLREGAADGSLRKADNPETTAAAIFGAVTIAGLAHLVRPATPDRTSTANIVVDILLHGLTARTTFDRR